MYLDTFTHVYDNLINSMSHTIVWGAIRNLGGPEAPPPSYAYGL